MSVSVTSSKRFTPVRVGAGTITADHPITKERLADFHPGDTFVLSDGSVLIATCNDADEDFHVVLPADLVDWIVQARPRTGASVPLPSMPIDPDVTLRALVDSLDANILDVSAMTDEEVDAEIRAAGGDPDEIARRGLEIVGRLLENRRERWRAETRANLAAGRPRPAAAPGKENK